MEDLVIAKRSGPGVRLPDGVHDSTQGVEYPAQQEQRQRHDRKPGREFGRGYQGQPADGRVEGDAEPPRGPRPEELHDDPGPCQPPDYGQHADPPGGVEHQEAEGCIRAGDEHEDHRVIEPAENATQAGGESASSRRITVAAMAAIAAQRWNTPRRAGRWGRTRSVVPVLRKGRLDVQAGLIVVALDEALTWGHFIAHELREDAVCGHGVFDGYLEHGAAVGVHSGFPELAWVHLTQALVSLDGDLAVLEPVEVGVLVLLGVEPADVLAALGAIQWRLGDVQVAAIDERAHVAEEEGEEGGGDVRAGDGGIGHGDDAVVAELGRGE